MKLHVFIHVRWLAIRDTIQYSDKVRGFAGWAYFAQGICSRNPLKRGAKLCRALGLASSERLRRLCIKTIHANPGFHKSSATWEKIVSQSPRLRNLLEEQTQLNRSIILKRTGEHGERGVILITFEYNWARLLLGLTADEIRWLEERYYIVFSTSWSPTDYALLALALTRIHGTVFVQSCNHGEITTLESFHPRLKCLPTMPCDWINPDLYKPKPRSERVVDLIMVANWGNFKRHWELLSALRSMPPSLKIVLIGQPEGDRTQKTIARLAQKLGVSQDINFINEVSIAEVAQWQCEARASVIMSRREGCCVAAVESLFAGCALGMRIDAHVGPLAYVNERTGLKLESSRLAEDLMKLIRSSEHLNPREWASENISGMRSLQKVSSFFEDYSRISGEPWNQSIVLPQWRPHPTFARSEDLESMRPIYLELHQRFPKVFAVDLITESWR
jgi:hypothetical protein